MISHVSAVARYPRRHGRHVGAARSRGLSLVEVLVSVLVLGLGLLGLAMLQVTNLRLTQSSNARTVATNLASMLLDDMRNNRLIAIGYAGTHTASSAAEDCTPNSAAATPVAQTTSFACSMRRALGAGARAQVAVNDATGVVSIAIEWGDAQRWNATGPTTRFVLETRL